MKVRKVLLVVILPVCIVISFFYLLFLKKSVNITLENRFGTFCLDCRTIEKGSGYSIYGFGLAYCDDKIKEMSNKIKYYEIERYKIYLKSNGFSVLSNRVADIAKNLKTEKTEEYFLNVKEYEKEINQLNSDEKKIILSYFHKT